jgi:hypothetical protein
VKSLSNKIRLPVPCKLEKGESLPGFISRATLTNNYNSISTIAKWFGIEDTDNGISKNKMRALAKGEVNLKQLASFTEMHIADVKAAILNLDKPINGSKADNFVSFEHWRFCPQCIREKRPHRRTWLISFVTSCDEHGCKLIDHCEYCGSPFSSVNILSRYCRTCQKPAQVVKATQEELECTQRVSSLIDNKVELMTLLNRLMLAWMITNPNALRAHYKMSPQLRDVCEMREIVTRLWPCCVSSEVFNLSLASYRATLSHHWKFLPELSETFNQRFQKLDFNQLPSDVQTFGSTFKLVNTDWWVPITEAAKSAGISTFILKKLISHKLINSKQLREEGTDNKQHRFILVDLSSLNTLITKLYEVSEITESTHELTSIQHYPIDEIIENCLSKKLKIYRTDTANTLSQLFVKNSDTEKARRKQTRPDDSLTAKESAKLLNTYHAVIADLVQHEILSTHLRSTNRRLLIEKQSVVDFNQKYVLIGALAAKYAINATNLAEKLNHLGIDAIDKQTLVKFFHRADVSKLTKDDLLNISSYQTNTGRKPTFDEKNISCPKVIKLLHLVTKHGGLSEFSRKFDVSIGNLSMILREKKSFGSLAARRMEKRLGLTNKWFETHI